MENLLSRAMAHQRKGAMVEPQYYPIQYFPSLAQPVRGAISYACVRACVRACGCAQ